MSPDRVLVMKASRGTLVTLMLHLYGKVVMEAEQANDSVLESDMIQLRSV